MSDQPVIVLNDIHKSYAGVEVLKGINLAARKGEMIAIIGSSGSGKSTLLRCINLLVTPDAGTVEVCGSTVEMRQKRGRLQPADPRAVIALRRKIGMVFQNFNLWDHMTALENVTKALVSVHGVPPKEADARGMALLEKVGLRSRATAYPGELSDGQCQRVAIARALAVEPQVLLFVLGFYLITGLLINDAAAALGYDEYIDISAVTSGIIFGAYATEVFRGAIQALDPGQLEAAAAFGMGRLTTFRRVVFPQMWRIALPGIGNLFMVLLENTALLSVIGVNELMRNAASAVGFTKAPFTFYLAAAGVYLGMTALGTLGLDYLERRAARGCKNRGV